MAFRYGKAVLTSSRAAGCHAHFRRTCCLKASRFWKTLRIGLSGIPSFATFASAVTYDVLPMSSARARHAAEQMHLDTCLDRTVNEFVLRPENASLKSP